MGKSGVWQVLFEQIIVMSSKVLIHDISVSLPAVQPVSLFSLREINTFDLSFTFTSLYSTDLHLAAIFSCMLKREVKDGKEAKEP